MWTFESMVQSQAEIRPDAPAIATLNRPPLTYGALLEGLLEIRGHLHRLGIDADHRVAVVVPDGVQLLFGTLAVGATAQAILVAPTTTASEFSDNMKRLGCSLAIVHADLEGVFSEAVKNLQLPYLIATRTADSAAGRWHLQADDTLSPVQKPSRAPRLPGLDDTAIIMTSSGTTGRPKLVPRSHRNCAAYAQFMSEAYDVGPNDCAMATTPMYLTAALGGGGFTALSTGGLCVTFDGSFAANQLADMFCEFLPTFALGSPTILRGLLFQLKARSNTLEGSRLRYIRAQSDKLPAGLRKDLEVFFGTPIEATYGSTEAPGFCSRSLSDDSRPETFLGRQLSPPGRGAIVVDDDGHSVPTGTIGQIAIMNDLVTKFYIDDEELNAKSFKNGLFLMGDLGFLDENGDLHYSGRKSDLIIRGGYNISPMEVELVLEDHPNIAEAAVVGVPHPTLGQDVALVVVPKPGAEFDEEMMRQHLAQRLAPQKWPRRLVLVDKLPRNALGKVRRGEVAAMIAGMLSDDDEPEFDAHRTPLEAVVVGLFSFILDNPRVGGSQGFIEAGGDSLQAAILHSELQGLFDVDLPPDVLLSPACTPKYVANLVEAAINFH